MHTDQPNFKVELDRHIEQSSVRIFDLSIEQRGSQSKFTLLGTDHGDFFVDVATVASQQ